MVTEELIRRSSISEIKIHDPNRKLSEGNRTGSFTTCLRSEMQPLTPLQLIWNKIRVPFIGINLLRRLS